jgi:hypothetical protein
MPDEKLIALLQENNTYLKQLLELQKKEHFSRVTSQVLNVLATLLPFILIMVAGWFAWQTINHYLDVMNNNINTLKTNFDALRDFFQRLIPDFSGIGNKLQDTWETVQFWNQ